MVGDSGAGAGAEEGSQASVHKHVIRIHGHEFNLVIYSTSGLTTNSCSEHHTHRKNTYNETGPNAPGERSIITHHHCNICTGRRGFFIKRPVYPEY